MRISDWSSDVCSSDLPAAAGCWRGAGGSSPSSASSACARGGRSVRLAWFDAFDLNAEPEPPDRELRQVVEPVGAGEGNAVVRADGVGRAALLEQATKERRDRKRDVEGKGGVAREN